MCSYIQKAVLQPTWYWKLANLTIDCSDQTLPFLGFSTKFQLEHPELIKRKNELCGGDGFFGQKNWRKIWPKNGLKWPKDA